MNVVTAVVLTVLAHVGFGGVRVVLSLAAIDQAATPLAVGSLLSLFSLGPMFLSVAGGRWIDRIGVRRPLFIGVGLMVAGSAIGWLPLGLPVLFVTSALVGSGFLLTQLVTQKLVGDAGHDHEARRRNFGLLAIGYSISGVVGPTAAGLLYDHLGPHDTFLAFTAMPLVILFSLLRHRDELPGPAPGIPVRRRFFDLLAEPRLRRLYLATALTSTAWDLHQFVVPIYGRGIGLSASDIGFILGAFGLATLFVRLVLPLFLLRLPEWTAIVSAQVVAFGVFVAYPFFGRFEALVALSFVLGLGLGLGQPMVLSLLHLLTPAGRVGEAIGLRLMIINATQTVLPGSFGALGSVFGVGILFWAVAAALGLGLLAQAAAGYNRSS
ncbi:MAG: MFS transporter [Burkholderiaceae bacterium]